MSKTSKSEQIWANISNIAKFKGQNIKLCHCLFSKTKNMGLQIGSYKHFLESLPMDWSGFGLPTAFFPFFLLLLLGGWKLLPWNSSLRCRWGLEQTWNKPFEFRLYTTSVLFCDLTLSSSSSSSSSGSIGTSSSSWSCCCKESTHHWITTHDPLTFVLPFLSNETSERRLSTPIFRCALAVGDKRPKRSKSK